jgi:hypothetical protein
MNVLLFRNNLSRRLNRDVRLQKLHIEGNFQELFKNFMGVLRASLKILLKFLKNYKKNIKSGVYHLNRHSHVHAKQVTFLRCQVRYEIFFQMFQVNNC